MDQIIYESRLICASRLITVTSVVISTWKQTYRLFLMQELVRDIESRAKRRAFYQGRTYGMNGIAQGYDPHMLDAANLAKLSWDNVSRMNIARCWVKGFREAVRRSNANATRQLLITEMFPRRSYHSLSNNKIR